MTRRLLPVTLLSTAGLALATATGKVAWVLHSLPFTETPNGFTLFCLLVLVGGCWWRMRQAVTTPHPSLDDLVDLETWSLTGEVGPSSEGSFCKGRLDEVDPAGAEARTFISAPLQHGRRARS